MRAGRTARRGPCGAGLVPRRSRTGWPATSTGSRRARRGWSVQLVQDRSSSRPPPRRTGRRSAWPGCAAGPATGWPGSPDNGSARPGQSPVKPPEDVRRRAVPRWPRPSQVFRSSSVDGSDGRPSMVPPADDHLLVQPGAFRAGDHYADVAEPPPGCGSTSPGTTRAVTRLSRRARRRPWRPDHSSARSSRRHICTSRCPRCSSTTSVRSAAASWSKVTGRSWRSPGCRGRRCGRCAQAPGQVGQPEARAAEPRMEAPPR